MATCSAPQFISLPVPPLPVQPGEVRWIYPPLVHQLVWDVEGGPGAEALAALRALLMQSLAAPLLPSQQQEVGAPHSCRLQSHPALTHQLRTGAHGA